MPHHPLHRFSAASGRCTYLGSYLRESGAVSRWYDVYLSTDPAHLCRDAAGNECAEVLVLINGQLRGGIRIPVADARGIVAEGGFLADAYRAALEFFDAR